MIRGVWENRKKATILEAGPGDIERYLRKPNWLEKHIREWAGNVIGKEQEALKSVEPQWAHEYLQYKKRVSDLSGEFQKMADPGLGGTIAAVKIIHRHYLGRLLGQPS